MNKILPGILLALVLVLATAAAAQASPLLPGEQGAVVVFGEYGAVGDYWGGDYRGFSFGLGYAFADNFSLGAAYQFIADYEEVFYLYCAATLGPVLFKADYWRDIGYGSFYKLSAAYLFDLDPFTLALGGFYFYDIGPEMAAYGLEIGANYAISDTLSGYAVLDYYLGENYDSSYGETRFVAKFGLASAF